ncbi:hypothetical protein, conserved [Leishmania tarentolae]|uniref:Uncharacterized protein n=1 Tax=Leishmania tarentolae TaxID=5689 RepID=A0A640KST6_LEITA|nr:hypothetical protein, conserved [Leishmania tarentolae]
MPKRRSTAALPTLREPADITHSVGTQRTVNVYKKNAFSLDGCLRSLPTRPAAPLTRTLGPAAGDDSLSNGGEAQSPAEALVARARAPLCGESVSSSISFLPGGESWRSELLRCETELRELVACGVRDPPLLSRTLKAVDLFDRVSSIIQAHPNTSFIGDLLRLFRIELCRSIFMDQNDGDHALGCSDDTITSSTEVRRNGEERIDTNRTSKSKSDSVLPTDGNQTRTYFEEVESLRRAKAFLTAAVAKSTSAESLLLLQRSIEDKDEQILWYETELSRIRRQFDQVSDECRQARQKLEAEAQEAISIQRQLQREIQTLQVENKDVQLQLFRLRKQITGGNSNQLKEAYRQMKLTKIAQTQSLFDEGDERVALLVLLGQVEGRVNEILDAYDNEYVLTPENLHRDLRSRMTESVVVLLEDMHFCDTAYRRLVAGKRTGNNKKNSVAADGNGNQVEAQRIPLELVHTGNAEEAPDETDGFVAILFDQRVYEHFQARHSLLERLQHYQTMSTANSQEKKESLTRPGGAKSSTRTDALTLRKETQTSVTSETVQDKRGSRTRGQAHSSDEQSGASPQVAVQKQDTLEGSTSARAGDSHLLHSEKVLSPLSRTPQRSPLSSSLPLTAPKQISDDPPTALPDKPTACRGPLRRRANRAQRDEWVSNILGPPTTSLAFTIPRPNSEQAGVVVVEHRIHEVAPAKEVMQRVLRHPMEDLSSERFLSTVEVFTGEDPVQQKLLCRMNYVDPSLAIQVPNPTNFVKVKYAHAENAREVAKSATASTGLAVSGSISETSNGGAGGGSGVYGGNPSLRLFNELGSQGLVESNPGLQYRAGAVSSTTASTVAFQRLNPLSPDRAPEWLLYKQLFGAYRSLTPRMIEVTTIDHLMTCASERFFVRMEYRYDECLERAAQQCANAQMRQDMAARLFKDMYVLSDFQEALVDELEARYGYPELVAKTLYEILCYLDAVVEKDSVLASYLNVIRGFVSPTQVHFVSYMLYHLSYCWPSADPTVAITAEEVRTVLDYLYRNASPLLLIDPENILKDYSMATRSAPLTFVSMRQFLASAMVHMEEPLLLHLHGRFHAYTQRKVTDDITWETYESVIEKYGRMKDERRSLVRFLSSSLGVNRPTFASLQQLTFLAGSTWCSNFWV